MASATLACGRPYDIAVTDFTNDQSRLEVARDLGIDFTVAPRLSVEEGIDAVRRFLPPFAIDRAACEAGLQGLQNYQYESNPVLRTFSAKPVHNWASHPSDSLRYFVTGHDPDADDQNETDKYPFAITAFDLFHHRHAEPTATQAETRFDVFDRKRR